MTVLKVATACQKVNCGWHKRHLKERNGIADTLLKRNGKSLHRTKGEIKMARKIIGMVALFIGVVFSGVALAQPISAPDMSMVKTQYEPAIADMPVAKPYIHGDCSWIPEVALQAGWPAETHKRLIHIIKRESGCCPRRIGGSMVDENCHMVKMLTWSHPSDSGLLQINGVHWKQDHPQYAGLICKQMGICTQKPLLNPLTNLKAGKLLYDVAGWSPWGYQN